MSPLDLSLLSLIAIVAVYGVLIAAHRRRLTAVELEVAILRSRLSAAGIREDTDRRW